MNFSELGLNDKILEAISYMGFETASPIQEKAIPEILQNKDVIACAQTGTGKTAAFMLPILHLLANKKNPNSVSALIIVPTRELALQIDQQIQGFSYFLSVTSLAIYGGGDGKEWETQKKALSGHSDIIVATPGKLISHINMGYVKFHQLQHLILDEADRMLDMGFYEDIQKIISHLPIERQTLMFSATMPPKIRQLINKSLRNPVEISISISKPAENVVQTVYLVYDTQKTELTKQIIDNRTDYQSILIFTSKKDKVSQIVRSLRNKNYRVEGISSDLKQQDRENVLLQFRSRTTKVLVATDVLSRGIDIKDINLIINYDVPGDAEDYVHRIGRTARAETKGEAITYVNEQDMIKFQRIEKLIEQTIPKTPLPNSLGEGPQWSPSSKKKNNKRSFKKRVPNRAIQS